MRERRSRAFRPIVHAQPVARRFRSLPHRHGPAVDLCDVFALVVLHPSVEYPRSIVADGVLRIADPFIGVRVGRERLVAHYPHVATALLKPALEPVAPILPFDFRPLAQELAIAALA